jgi:hypothetical protein
MIMKPSVLILAAATLAASTLTADAAIQCRNGAQLVSGSYIITPYCQDKLLAQVARQYGSRASFAQIRDNPNIKRHVCRLVGRDIRVFENCITVNPNGRRAF